MRRFRLPVCAALAALCCLSGAPRPAWAQVQQFLTDREALRVALGDAERVRALSMRIGGEEQARIEKGAGVPLLLGWTRCYQGLSGGRVIAYACIDNVIGKERPITYVVRIDHPSGRIGLLEVMEYREAIGAEVNAPDFREQFRGKSADDPVRLNEDIRNLAGATLSSRGLASGARKILHLYDAFLRHLPPP